MATDGDREVDGRRHRVMIVDDHPIVRQGLCALLAEQPDLEVCGEADDIEEAVGKVETTEPDLVVVDISLKSGNGLLLINRLKVLRPQLKTLVWSMFDERLYAERALKMGAAGYVNKQEAIEQLVDAIRRVLEGEVYLSESMTRGLLERVSNGSNVDRDPILALSEREMEVFEMIGEGNTTQRIAQELGVSSKTVEAHRERIKAKLDLKDAAQLSRAAVLWSMQKGWPAPGPARAAETG